MKNRDTGLFIALIVLIVLVIILLAISLSRSSEIKELKIQIQNIQQREPREPKDGHTPIEGIDYTVRNGENGTDAKQWPKPKDGQDSISTHTIEQVPIDNYMLALKDGFQGTLHDWLESLKVKGDKGDPADDIQLSCINGVINTKRTSDFFYQPTNIKCEATNE